MSIARRAAGYAALCTALAVLATAAVAAMPGAKAWAVNARGGISATETESELEPTGPPGTAMLVRGRAIATAGPKCG